MLQSKTLYFFLTSLFVYTISSLSFSSDEKLQNDTDKLNNSGITVYGNWCGRNHPVDINKANDPIDILDQQCKTHDLCYVAKGDFNCGCDRAMVLKIDDTQKQKIYTSHQYFLAQNIKIHFSVSPCDGEVDGNKMMPTRVLTKIYNGAKKKVINTYNHLADRFF